MASHTRSAAAASGVGLTRGSLTDMPVPCLTDMPAPCLTDMPLPCLTDMPVPCCRPKVANYIHGHAAKQWLLFPPLFVKSINVILHSATAQVLQTRE